MKPARHRHWLLCAGTLFALAFAAQRQMPAAGHDSGDGDLGARTWLHPVSGQPYASAELERLKYLARRFPDNPLVVEALNPFDLEQRRRQETRLQKIARAMTAGLATEEDIESYYAHQRRVLRARAQLVDFVLSEPQWSSKIREKYQRIQNATQKQLGELQLRTARSIGILKKRQAKDDAPIYARIGPHTSSVAAGEAVELTSRVNPDVTVTELIWLLPGGTTATGTAVQVSTTGLSVGLHEALLIATIADGKRSTDVAFIEVKTAPTPALDLAIGSLEYGQLPDAAEGAEGKVAVQSVVQNKGTTDVDAATVYFTSETTALHQVDGIALKSGESRVIVAALFDPAAFVGATITAAVVAPKPLVDEHPANDSLTVPVDVSPHAPLTEFAPTAPRHLSPSRGRIPPPDGTLAAFVTNMAPLPIDLGPVDGFADLHIHQMGDLGYDGRLFWGSYDGPDEETAVPECSGMNHAICWLPSPLADIGGRPEIGAHAGLASSSFLTSLLSGGAAPPAYCIDPLWTGGANSVVKGWHSNNTTKRFKDWPVWHTVTHQQVYREWLEEAHNAGLNLIVMSAVSSKTMCSLIPSSKGFGATGPFDDVIPEGLSPDALELDREIAGADRCDDMKNVRRQLLAAWEFDQDYDWYEIALTPGHARAIIQEGRLAVVLSIEAGELFDNPADEAALFRQFDYFTNNLGVRSIQPLHQIENVFGGPSYFSPIINFFDTLDDNFSLAAGFLSGSAEADASAGIDAAQGVGLNRNASGDNNQVMTPLGIQMLLASMDRGLLFDIAHLNRRGSNQAYNIARARNYYPLFVSHLRYQDLLWEDPHDDHLAKAWQVMQEVKDLSGVVGLRTTHRRQRTYPATEAGGPFGDIVDDTCPGSTRSLAQAYLYGALGMGLPQAFASDMTGFIENARPRFWDGDHPKYDKRDWACSQNANASGRNWFQSLQGDRATNGTGTDFDLTGFGKVSQFGDLLSDLRDNLGVETVEVENSANAFVDMWTRAQSSFLRGPGTRCIDRRSIAGGPSTPGPLQPGC